MNPYPDLATLKSLTLNCAPGAGVLVGVVWIAGSTALVTIPTRVWIADATFAHCAGLVVEESL